jgi:pimeloyl-ACP methyl ester carboxylesterase
MSDPVHREEEERRARIPLLLLPGVLNDGDLWAHQARHLSGIAEVHVGDTSSHDVLSDLAAAILAKAPESFALAGLSMGGYVAFEMLRQAPERVLRLALVDTSARPDTQERKQHRRGLIQLAERGQFRGVTPRMLPWLIAARHLENESLTKRIYAMAERVGRDGFVNQERSIMERADSRPMLGSIRVPTIVICGRDDKLTPPARAEEMAGGIPGADLLVVAGAGHLAPMERPFAVTRALRGWLQRSWTPDRPSMIGAKST